MKLRFIKGTQQRTILIRNRIVHVIAVGAPVLRFDLNNFDREKEKIKNQDEATQKMLEKIATLKGDDEIYTDIKKDYEEDGWVCR